MTKHSKNWTKENEKEYMREYRKKNGVKLNERGRSNDALENYARMD